MAGVPLRRLVAWLFLALIFVVLLAGGLFLRLRRAPSSEVIAPPRLPGQPPVIIITPKPIPQPILLPVIPKRFFPSPRLGI